MKVVFMGTPDFAVPSLEALFQAEHEIGLVIARPDRARGRGRKMQFPPVKEKALALGLVCSRQRTLQPRVVIFLRSSGSSPSSSLMR